jgi:crotonobetainyl-CoA:carnitine CoA-transferase CaiB-like acyl-CoA transferase
VTAAPVASPGALHGVRVVDFSGLLPGPLASLLLAEAGAEVVKIERPGTGDDMRARRPTLGTSSAQFALLNRGKRSVAIDLKSPTAFDELAGLLASADVLLEQFRPGVMAKLGFGYAAVRAINPRIVYCSRTGYGQTGERAQVAGHDLNYVAASGLLSLATGRDGAPAMPAALVGDIAGGTLPAVINILLALLQRERTGEGCHLDVAMADNAFPFLYWALARGFATGAWPPAGPNELTGTSPRYRTYRTKDGRYLAVGALEDRFWSAFCAAIELPDAARALAGDALADAVAARIASRTAADWEDRLTGRDACTTVVRTVAEAVADPVFAARALFDRTVRDGAYVIPALPVPLAPTVRAHDADRAAPALGEASVAELGRA